MFETRPTPTWRNNGNMETNYIESFALIFALIRQSISHLVKGLSNCQAKRGTELIRVRIIHRMTLQKYNRIYYSVSLMKKEDFKIYISFNRDALIWYVSLKSNYLWNHLSLKCIWLTLILIRRPQNIVIVTVCTMSYMLSIHCPSRNLFL